MSTQTSGGGSSTGLLERQGIARHLLWGFIAVILFQTGNGMELGFYSGFLQDRGITSGQVAAMTMAYGIVIAIASWFSGSLADAWGPRRVMMMGFGAWLIFELVFLWGGVTTGSYAVMVIGYALRGFGYPLFCYGFLAWVTMDTPEEHLGRGVGWFWFAQSLGMGALGAYIPSWFLIPAFGEMGTLWTSFIFVIIGGLLALFLVRRPKELQTAAETGSRPSAGETMSGLVKGITILGEHPKTAVGGVVRIINQAAFYGIPVFFAPWIVSTVGMDQGKWLTIWGTLNLANVFANLVFGYVGDAFGRVRTVAWFGGLGCGIAVFLMWWFPSMWGANFAAELIAGILFGIGLAAYVPLSAIMPLLAPERKGSAVAILNLGAGLSNFAGPALAPLAGPLGVGGLMIIYAALHIVGGGMTYALNPSKGDGNQPGAGTGTPEAAPAGPDSASS
ncbi:MFS transporter [Acidipropionibacterium virtanenii]|uniref:Alpha-ketoglutarate permease n=1 Tax=Acidipropionibacterium virtanenii TaxID=2057246 RepID=A0A344UWZ5_9ACTN|nr:MFS transporter [Acidipropionibacterium virtanenii]AXE39793.1 Alpha-ketoglutarate permease [Acidipropionibacterium virtanenii]